MAVIIVEGVVATGKTTLVNELTRHPAWSRKATRSVISEHYTERVLELTKPTVANRVQLLERHMSHIRDINALWTDYRFHLDHTVAPVVLLERFHVTHAAQVGDFTPFQPIDDELSSLGASLVFFYHPRELLLQRILATEHSRNSMWQRWLRSLGTEAQIEDYFWTLQNNTMHFLSCSTIKVMAIEAHSKSAQAIVEDVLTFSGLTT